MKEKDKTKWLITASTWYYDSKELGVYLWTDPIIRDDVYNYENSMRIFKEKISDFGGDPLEIYLTKDPISGGKEYNCIVDYMKDLSVKTREADEPPETEKIDHSMLFRMKQLFYKEEVD